MPARVRGFPSFVSARGAGRMTTASCLEQYIAPLLAGDRTTSRATVKAMIERIQDPVRTTSDRGALSVRNAQPLRDGAGISLGSQLLP